MSQAKNKKKFKIAGSSACPAAVDARWFQIRRFGSTPETGDSFLSPNKPEWIHSTSSLKECFFVIPQLHTGNMVFLQRCCSQ